MTEPAAIKAPGTAAKAMLPCRQWSMSVASPASLPCRAATRCWWAWAGQASRASRALPPSYAATRHAHELLKWHVLAVTPDMQALLRGAAAQVFQISVSSTYGVTEFKENLLALYTKAGMRGIPITFLLTDNQIVNEKFLVYINDLLSTGYVADLCSPVRPAPCEQALPLAL